MKVRLTKKRVRALETAISFDDILYEKFRRLSDDLNRRWEQFHRSKRIVQVAQRQGDVLVMLKVESIERGPDGIRVICR